MLEINRLSVAYGNHLALKDVTLAMKSHETYCLVGESGSGKTTLLKAITGLLGEGGRYIEGEVVFEGKELISLPQPELRKLRGAAIATVHQQAGSAMDPIMKVGKQFHEALSVRAKISRRESDRLAQECMKTLALKEPERILKSYPGMLSGGTIQRVALAMAMAMNPTLILADEPTSALDVTVQVEVVGTLKKLQENCSAAMLLVTHNIGVVARMADKIGVMLDGRLIESGSKAQVLSSPAHPYTHMLINSVLNKKGRLPMGPTIYHEEKTQGCSFYNRCPLGCGLCRETLPQTREIGSDHRVMCRLAGEKYAQ
ncbi:oligopeptide/dipeptide ABC transporter ATP-binding protein [Desulfitobacterium sp. LBE]|uniref:Oligopeptide/dipeptide ABC transporter, ATPase subunit n=1 Tax=Desulfitobacterium hafniense (strain DSM 10664 / DCB-2) TaxID=272564 RepID=B8G1N2_DESHD|nr:MULTISPECIES: ABC transporter ATP-binding protein [Desulfitobacterium]ACL18405.1 oligopeptide/dipeptide ABC transporter, ATPase subunit [Desulfitobacterium hafniense DCB-2]TWH58668.1 oligopeptide/dipeptide ABC transporter ATP-binding protein [Desulfitobacterium sp. LBE]